MFRRLRETRRRWQQRIRLLPVVFGFGLAVWGLIPLIAGLTGNSRLGAVAGAFLIVVGLAIGVPALRSYRRQATR